MKMHRVDLIACDTSIVISGNLLAGAQQDATKWVLSWKGHSQDDTTLVWQERIKLSTLTTFW